MKTSLQKLFTMLASVLLIVGGIAGMGWLLWSREPLLLAQSTSLLYTTNWVSQLVNDALRPTRNFQHAWVSDHQLLYARKRPDKEATEAYEFVLRDLNTGNETPLPGLRQRVLQSEGWVDDETLSPDRQWLLFHCWYAGTFVCRLDGSDYAAMGTYCANSSSFWHGTQGHEVVRVYRSNHLAPVMRSTLCDVSQPKQATPFSISAAEAEEYELAYHLSHEPPAAAITVFGKALHLPFLAKVNTASVSPSRDRIALELEGERTSFWEQWLHRFFPSTKMQATSERSLWVPCTRSATYRPPNKMTCSIFNGLQIINTFPGSMGLVSMLSRRSKCYACFASL